MTEQDKGPEVDANGGGNEPDNGEQPTLTKAQFEAAVKERLARERKKYENYDELKEKASKFEQLEEAQKTELEKERDARLKAEKLAEERTAVANRRLIQAEFIKEASRQNVLHPEDAFNLADKTGLDVGDNGKVEGVAEVVEALVKDGRLPLSGKPKAGETNAGAGELNKKDEPTLTEDERQMAAKLGLTPEQYLAGKKKQKE